MTTPDRRLKLTIVGGFLGSGKTTWLRHQLHEGRFAKAHVLVNEAAGTPVDDSLLGLADDLTVLAGGCACCEGQADFEAALLAVCDARSTVGHRAAELTEIVLETSGLADPSAIVALIQAHPVLIRHILVAEVIVIVDALYGLDALRSEPLARAQISAADRLIMSKADSAPEENVGVLRGHLQRLAPGADQSGASFGSPAPLVDTQEPSTPLAETTSNASTSINVCQLDVGQAPDWTALTLWLSALLHVHGAQIVRVKGVVASPAGDLLIQAVRNTVQSPEKIPARTEPVSSDKLILIGSGLDCAAVQHSFQKM